MRRAAKTDLNHSSIRDGLRERGYAVEDLSRLGGGVPDLLVAWDVKDLANRKVYRFSALLEVKAPKGKLNPEQVKFHERWPGPLYVVRSVVEAVAALQDAERSSVGR